MSEEDVGAARKLLEERWDAAGACRSCGWHAALYEYDVDDFDIRFALRSHDQTLWLPCLSDQDEDGRHRGVRVYLGPEEPLAHGLAQQKGAASEE